MAIKNNILAVGCLAMLMLSACTADNDPAAEQEIALTTPVIALGGVSASAGRATTVTMSKAQFTLALYTDNNHVYNADRTARYAFTNGGWSSDAPLTVTGGEGNYRASLSGTACLAGSPDIIDATYAYQGSISVQTNGTFTPGAALSAYSAAVLVNLKNANGEAITSGNYQINPVGLAKMAGFAGGTSAFPHGTTGTPVYAAAAHPAYLFSDGAYGDFCPGTYPATWSNGVLSEKTPSAAWPIFEVEYYAEDFVGDTAQDPFTTWTVSYPEQQLTLEAGKLYTFTITLGKDADITLDAANALTIDQWAPGSTIEVGK